MKMVSTSDVLDRHLKSFAEHDVDSVVSDYSLDAVLFAPSGPLKGPDAIKPLFEFHRATASTVGGNAAVAPLINPSRQRLASVPAVPRPAPSWCSQMPASPSQHRARCQLEILPMVASCQLLIPKFRPQNHRYAPTEVFFLVAYCTSAVVYANAPPV